MATRAPVVLVRLHLVGFLQVRFTSIEEREKAWRGERAEALAQLEKEKEVVEILEEKNLHDCNVAFRWFVLSCLLRCRRRGRAWLRSSTWSAGKQSR